MVRKFRIEDLDKIMEIWLKVNKEAHDFIKESYWEDNFENVKKLIVEAELYVAEKDGIITGFAGVTDKYIAGFFVDSDFQSQGIGSGILNHIKNEKSLLQLHVYKKNNGAVKFYMREGFRKKAETLDNLNKETEYLMEWKK